MCQQMQLPSFGKVRCSRLEPLFQPRRDVLLAHASASGTRSSPIPLMMSPCSLAAEYPWPSSPCASLCVVRELCTGSQADLRISLYKTLPLLCPILSLLIDVTHDSRSLGSDARNKQQAISLKVPSATASKSTRSLGRDVAPFTSCLATRSV